MKSNNINKNDENNIIVVLSMVLKNVLTRLKKDEMYNFHLL